MEVYSWKISYAAAKKDVVEIGESGDLVFNDELFVSITKQNSWYLRAAKVVNRQNIDK